MKKESARSRNQLALRRVCIVHRAFFQATSVLMKLLKSCIVVEFLAWFETVCHNEEPRNATLCIP